METAINQFNDNINRVRDLIALHNSLKSQTTNVLDISDILRAALVLTLSALDYYIHEVVRIGMLEIYTGKRAEPSVSANTNQSAFSRFKVSLGNVVAMSNSSTDISNNTAWLEQEIREHHSYLSFQHPDKIADAIRLISAKKLWQEVSNIMQIPATDIKQQLSIIVDRRNKIAHEADIDPSYNIGNRWPIDENLIENAVNFIEQVVNAIHQLL